jgi:hypothetical protein
MKRKYTSIVYEIANPENRQVNVITEMEEDSNVGYNELHSLFKKKNEEIPTHRHIAVQGDVSSFFDYSKNKAYFIESFRPKKERYKNNKPLYLQLLANFERNSKPDVKPLKYVKHKEKQLYIAVYEIGAFIYRGRGFTFDAHYFGHHADVFCNQFCGLKGISISEAEEITKFDYEVAFKLFCETFLM